MRHSLVIGILLGLCLHSPVSGASLKWDYDTKFDYELDDRPIPHWSGGGLIAIVKNHAADVVVQSFDDRGRGLPAIIFTIPEATIIHLRGTAHAPDGTMALCGSAIDGSERSAEFLSLISSSGEVLRTIRTSPYTCYRIALAPDNSIWTVGLEIFAGIGEGADRSYDVLRHFDASGKLLGSFIPRSTLASSRVVNWGYLEAAHERVGWYTGPVFGPQSKYYEVLSNGSVVQYPGLELGTHDNVVGLAVTESGTFLDVRVRSPDAPSASEAKKLLGWSKSRNSWIPVHLPNVPGSPRWAWLYGGDADRLVFQTTEHSVLRFVNSAAIE